MDDQSYSDNMKVSIAVVSVRFIIGLTLVTKNYWITQSLLIINVPDTENYQDD